MGGASTLVAFSAGVVLGVFITQNYKIPDVKQGVDWLVSRGLLSLVPVTAPRSRF